MAAVETTPVGPHLFTQNSKMHSFWSRHTCWYRQKKKKSKEQVPVRHWNSSKVSEVQQCLYCWCKETEGEMLLTCAEADSSSLLWVISFNTSDIWRAVCTDVMLTAERVVSISPRSLGWKGIIRQRNKMLMKTKQVVLYIDSQACWKLWQNKAPQQGSFELILGLLTRCHLP